MIFHLDTAPVWDAFRLDSECPLCDLEAETEGAYLDSFLGESVMDPGTRLGVNEKGFCGRHFQRMLALNNRLGLALMTHSHLQETIERFSSPEKKVGLRRKAKTPPAGEECALCERLSLTMNRYQRTALRLWRTEPAFARLVEKGKGLCLPHYRSLLALAGRELSGPEQAAFSETLFRAQKESLARIERELDWFTRKFDYRNAGEPWGESRDAPQRAIQKLRGRA